MVGGTVCHLELGGQVIARIVTDGYEFPWTYGRLVGSPAFERFRPYFSDPEGWLETPELEGLCEEVAAKGGFLLRDLSSGDAYESVTLNQDRDVVWFRYGNKVT